MQLEGKNEFWFPKYFWSGKKCSVLKVFGTKKPWLRQFFGSEKVFSVNEIFVKENLGENFG